MANDPPPIPQDRSPKSPRITLEAAVESTAKLFNAARRTPISREAAAKALGYSGMSGSATTALGALSGYGLTVRKEGNICVSERAVAILHPTSSEQKKDAIKDAALEPKVFRDLAKTHLECSMGIIASKLIQDRFTPEAAKVTAKVFLSNAEYAGLTSLTAFSAVEDNGDDEEELSFEQPSFSLFSPDTKSPEAPTIEHRKDIAPPPTITEKVLAVYQIPLGSNQAQLTFTGDQLEPEDFEALIEYVMIFQKQFERQLKQKSKMAPTDS